MIGLVLHLPKFMVYYGFVLALFLVILVLAKRLAGKSVSDMTYIVSSGTLNLNSINQSLQCWNSDDFINEEEVVQYVYRFPNSAIHTLVATL